MDTYIGVDLGTSGVKLLLVDAAGGILAEARKNYPVSHPQSGWCEQEPSVWKEATFAALSALLRGQERSAVRGIAFAGQMHGLVALDGRGEAIRPCILWNDARAEEETAYLNDTIGRKRLLAATGNVAFAGFTAPKLLWMRRKEPEAFSRIRTILLPKDYLAYLFTGAYTTDFSDASGTLLLDVKKRAWSGEMCRICGINRSLLPVPYESGRPVGALRKELAAFFGLSDTVKVIAGAGDNAAAAVGTGTVRDGDCNVSLGTSGTLFLAGSSPFASDGTLHSFCHANGKWHALGCILSAASCLKWWEEDVLGLCRPDALEAAMAASSADSGVYFLPYLAGERCPHNDVTARGAFLGLTAETTRADMGRAVLEGVAFALRDCLQQALSAGAAVRETKLCGGGAKSPLWRQIVADVLDMPVSIPQTEQGPAYGAAMLAMVGCGAYACAEQAADSIVKVRERILPKNAAVYRNKYETFRRLYPALRGVLT